VKGYRVRKKGWHKYCEWGKTLHNARAKHEWSILYRQLYLVKTWLQVESGPGFCRG